MKMSDFRNLDVNNIGSWPVAVKALFIVLVCSAILALAWYYDTKGQQETLKAAEQKEAELKLTFESRQRKAANLDALKRQLEDIKATFGDMLRRLPNKTEVAALLVDISQQGLGAGLEFELFKPGNEQPAEFYVELPIQIRVTGNYHQFGTFISGVSDLPRIVTNHNIQIKNLGGDKGLVMETTAKTYRYMDEEEESQEPAQKATP
jgi:type IV pilus assembly protein PilO